MNDSSIRNYSHNQTPGKNAQKVQMQKNLRRLKLRLFKLKGLTSTTTENEHDRLDRNCQTR